MKQSNVAVIPNVYVRSATPLEADRTFIGQVRGRSAIRLLLQRLAKDQDQKAASRIAFPEGPIRSSDQIDIEFRCPNGHCESTNYRTRLCLLDIALVDRCTGMFGIDIREVVKKALALPRSMSRGTHSSQRGLVPIRLTLYEDNMLSDQDIELALYTLVEDGH
jgi:hypothetical protein